MKEVHLHFNYLDAKMHKYEKDANQGCQSAHINSEIELRDGQNLLFLIFASGTS